MSQDDINNPPSDVDKDWEDFYSDDDPFVIEGSRVSDEWLDEPPKTFSPQSTPLSPDKAQGTEFPDETLMEMVELGFMTLEEANNEEAPAIVLDEAEIQAEMNLLFKDLNHEQRKAAEHFKGPCMVNAGAGTGKTTVMIHRVAGLLLRGVKPGNIVIMTFTNKAAQEIKERLVSMIGDAGKEVIAGTFHSIIFQNVIKACAHSPYLEKVGINVPELVILDEKDANKIFLEMYKEADAHLRRPLEEDGDKSPSKVAKELRERMSLARAAGMNADDFARSVVPGGPNQALEAALADTWRRYEACCRAYNGVDFDDILVHAYKMFQHDPEIAQEFADVWKHVNLDEYQDTNGVQAKIIDTIMQHQKEKNLFVVGDEKQSIYAFRGSDIRVILGFEKQYPGAEKLGLTINYRSPRAIIQAANNVATKMHDKLTDGQLSSASEEEVQAPRLLSFADEYDEAYGLAKNIGDLLASGIQPSEIAVIYPRRAKAEALKRELFARKIDFYVVGDQQFFEAAHVKDALSLLKFVVTPHDRSGGLRFIDCAKMGISSNAVIKTMEAESVNLMGALKHMSEERKLAKKKGELGEPTKRAKAAGKLHELITCANEFVQLSSDYQKTEKLIQAIHDGLIPFTKEKDLDIETETNEAANKRLDNEKAAAAKGEDVKLVFDLFIRAMQEGASPNEALESIIFRANNLHDDVENKIQLMTAHASKGLEFDYVFAIGNDLESDEDYDLENTDGGSPEFREDLRLWYVEVTRAVKKFSATCARKRYLFGSKTPTEMVPSPVMEGTFDKNNIYHVKKIENRPKPNGAGGNGPRSP